MSIIISKEFESSSLWVASDSRASKSLRPTTSVSTERYEKVTKVYPSHTQIEPGLFLYSREPEPAYLPLQWSAHIHPEGQLYFCCDATPRIVTEAYLYNPENMQKIVYWSKFIEDSLVQRDISLSNTVELYLQLEDSDSCAYYFIDHATRTEFWMDSLDTELLGIPPVISTSHLKIALEEHYWAHVEHFSMHLEGFSPHVVDELISIFCHAQVDRMTSTASTFPYTADDYPKYLSLLKSARDHISDGRATCLIARLWTAIANHRFNTHYGQEHARLSRDQAILVSPYHTKGCISALSSRLSLGVSDLYLERFEDIFVDNLVYVDQWRPFMLACLRDWKGSSFTSFLSLGLHIPLFFISSSPVLGIASGVMFGASIASSGLLISRHEPLVDATAAQAATHLTSIRSEKHMFHPVAFTFSLPKAFYLWGLGLFIAHWLIIAAQYHLGVAAGLSIFILVLIAGIRWTTSPKEATTTSLLPQWFSKSVAETSQV